MYRVLIVKPKYYYWIWFLLTSDRILASLIEGSAIPVKRHGLSGLVSAGGGGGAWFEDDYTDSSEWTQNGTEITVDDSYSDAVGGTAITQSSTNQRVYRSLPGDLNDELWYMDITMNSVSQNQYAQLFSVVLSSGNTYAYGTVDLIGIDLAEDNGSKVQIRGWARYTASGSGQIHCTGVLKDWNTVYYYRLSRDSSTQITLTLFTDEAGGTVASGFPQSATIPSDMGTGDYALDTIQHSNNATGDVRSQNWWATNVKIYDNEAP